LTSGRTDRDSCREKLCRNSWQVSRQNYCILGEAIVLFGAFAGRGPGPVARNRRELFAQFAGNEKFSSPLGLTPVERRLQAGEGAKCSELLRALEAMQRTPLRHIITLSQAMRDGVPSNTSRPHNGQSLAMEYLKGWTLPLSPLSQCSWLFGASTASTCWIWCHQSADSMHNTSWSMLWRPWFR
jgi:hypothetical protein